MEPPKLEFSHLCLSCFGVSEKKQEPITDLFDQIARNFELEILGRYLWQENQLDGKRVTNFSRHNAANCVVTHHALMIACFGNQFRLNPSLSTISSTSRRAISELKDIMVSREASACFSYRLLQGMFTQVPVPLDEDNWTMYSLKICSQECHVHAFVILQALENNEVIYKIYQSYIGQYNYEEYMKRYDRNYKSAEIFHLLDCLSEFVTSGYWTGKIQRLFSFYFKSDEVNPIGQAIKYKRSLVLRWGNVSRRDFERQAVNFRAAIPEGCKIEVL